MNIISVVNGKELKREFVIKEELKRTRVACRKLGIDMEGKTIEQLRDELVEKKLQLGHSGVRKLLHKEVSLIGKTFKVVAKLSKGKLVKCEIILKGQGLSGKDFYDWMMESIESSDEASMLKSHPEHYIQDCKNGRQTVCETVGGSPVAAEFVIDMNNKGNLMKDRNIDYPYNICGQAVDEEGTILGGALHQFKDTPDGFEGRLCIYFPRLLPKHIVKKHQIHLAMEFSNWALMAANDRLAENR